MIQDHGLTVDESGKFVQLIEIGVRWQCGSRRLSLFTVLRGHPVEHIFMSDDGRNTSDILNGGPKSPGPRKETGGRGLPIASHGVPTPPGIANVTEWFPRGRGTDNGIDV